MILSNIYLVTILFQYILLIFFIFFFSIFYIAFADVSFINTFLNKFSPGESVGLPHITYIVIH